MKFYRELRGQVVLTPLAGMRAGSTSAEKWQEGHSIFMAAVRS